MNSYFPSLINQVKDTRRKWKIPKTKESDKLISFFLKKNERKVDKGFSLLQSLWCEPKGFSIKEAQTVDLVEELKQYSEKEIEIILENTFAIELTKGCTGGCYFCLYGKKPGITKKYSFQSLVNFYSKFGHLLSSNIFFAQRIREECLIRWGNNCSFIGIFPCSDNSTLLHNDSDPLSYFDTDENGEHTFIDVYRIMVKDKEKKVVPEITTTIPPGSQVFFVKLIEGLFYDTFVERKEFPLIRISLAKHNVQRVELTLLTTFYHLHNLGYTSEQISFFFDNDAVCRVALRDETTLWNVGPLVAKADSFREIMSPHCIDGVVLSPGDNRSMVLTAANCFCPSGSKRYKLSPGKVFDRVVNHTTLQEYARYYDTPPEKYSKRGHLLHLRTLMYYQKIFLTSPKLVDSNAVFSGIDSDSESERVSFLLSRYCFAFRHVLDFTYQLDMLQLDNNLFDQYLGVFISDYSRARGEAVSVLRTALKLYEKNKNEILSSKQLSQVQWFVELKYSIRLMIFYLSIFDYLRKIARRKNPQQMLFSAKILSLLGKKHEKSLHSIFLLLDFYFRLDDFSLKRKIMKLFLLNIDTLSLFDKKKAHIIILFVMIISSKKFINRLSSTIPDISFEKLSISQLLSQVNQISEKNEMIYATFFSFLSKIEIINFASNNLDVEWVQSIAEQIVSKAIQYDISS